MINSINSANSQNFGKQYVLSIRLPKTRGKNYVSERWLKKASKSLNQHIRELSPEIINRSRAKKLGASPYTIPFAPKELYYNFAVDLNKVTPEVRQLMLNVEKDLGNAIMKPVKTSDGETKLVKSIGSVFIA